MKVKTLYVCEVCGSEYLHERHAMACETFPEPPKPPLRVGQQVRVYERYDAPTSDEVEAVSLVAGGTNEWANGNVNEDAWMRMARHEWVVTVKKHHRMSKDQESYTKTVGPENIVVDGRWLTKNESGEWVLGDVAPPKETD